MTGRGLTRVCVAALLMPVCARAASPAPPTPPATLPGTVSAAPGPAAGGQPPVVGDRIPVTQLVNLAADRLNAVAIFPENVSGSAVYARELPQDSGQAVAALNDMLGPAGYQVIPSRGAASGRLVLRVVTAEQARAEVVAQSPVTYGTDPAKVDVSDRSRVVTHVVPLTHGELLATIQRSLAEDKDLSVTATGGGGAGDRYQLVLSGPAGNVRRALQTIVAIDKPPPTPEARAIKLEKLSADAAVEVLKRQFPEAGTGEDQLHLVADPRTQTVLLSGPAALVDQATVLLKGLEAAAPEPPPLDLRIPERTPSMLPTPPEAAVPPATQPGRQVLPGAGRARGNR